MAIASARPPVMLGSILFQAPVLALRRWLGNRQRLMVAVSVGLLGVLALALVWTFAGESSPSEADSANLLWGRAPEVATFVTESERLTDGVIATPGSTWNCDKVAHIASGGSVEWDLGQERPLRRAFIQADNDDHYAVVVSRDRETWTDAWEAGPVQGAGLANRDSSLNIMARYVRLEARGGDGRYSVGELSLSAEENGAWPPALKEDPGESSEVRGKHERELLTAFAAVLAAAALLLIWRAGNSAHRARWMLPGITALASLVLIVTAFDYTVKHGFHLVDDAYISLQYAKNLASGYGLVFNPGERVEGYTNFLWTLLLAPLWPLSEHDPLLMTRLASWVSLAFAVTGLALVAAIAGRVHSRAPTAAVFAVLLTVMDDAYVSYPAVFALENQLLIALMLAGLALYVYRPKQWQLLLGLSFALVAMTRPDGLLWGGTFLLVQLLHHWRSQSSETAGLDWPALGKIAAAFAGVFGAYFFFRYWYFGELLPNTFHLKVGNTFDGLSRGYKYLSSYVSQRYGLPLLAFGAVFVARAPWVHWLLVHALLHAAYVGYVGGDFYAGHRFLLALTPNLALLCGVILAYLLRAEANKTSRQLILVAAIAACIAVRWGTLKGGPFTFDLYRTAPTVANNVAYMRWMKQVARPKASMVVGDIGATGFFADLSVLDHFGVVDPAVARKKIAGFGTGWTGHEKRATREEHLARKPTYIKWGYIDDLRRPPGYYIFNDFPRHLRVEGLWVRDDLDSGKHIAEHAFRFEQKELAAWTGTRSLLRTQPATGARGHQAYVNGQYGSFINTFTEEAGDKAIGSLLSPEFPLIGDRMRLLVGGGSDPKRLRVSLIVGGERVFSETGTNWETLGRREWDIRPVKGKIGRIEIVDNATGAWGHLMVDEIEQWTGAPRSTNQL